jgi:hypothetical protein
LAHPPLPKERKMKRKYYKRTIFDQLGCLLVKLSILVFLVLTFSSIEIDVKMTKKKNSFIADVSNVVDSGYSIAKRVKGVIK